MPSESFSIVIKKPIKDFKKNIVVDSDKSISIRSFLIGSICEGVSAVKNVLESEDVFSTINCLRKLNVKINYRGKKTYEVFGRGLGSYTAEKNLSLDFGNSGTASRILTSILSTTPNMNVRLTGDRSLKKRSMQKLITLMTKFGAEFFPKNKFFFPLRISSSNYPIGITYESGTSAQLKSAVILAGLNSYGNTEITEKLRSRDHTENFLVKNKKAIKIENGKIKKIKIYGKKNLSNFSINVPGDPSSAAFFTALTLLKKKSHLKIKNVGLNPTRIGFYSLLKKSGAKISFLNKKKINNELVGDIVVKSGKLKPINASKKYYLNTTDEYPILFIISAFIKGKSSFSGILDLKNKESDRIGEMQKILKQIGIYSKYQNDKLIIIGKKFEKRRIKKIKVPSLGDHRICQSAAILGLLTGIKVEIKNFETVRTSAPSFLKIVKKLGGSFEKKI
tara:strand:+ start:1681 stop:3027 length:1347 start_codon:yes stop_codon:yes gene_type:complete